MLSKIKELFSITPERMLNVRNLHRNSRIAMVLSLMCAIMCAWAEDMYPDMEVGLEGLEILFIFLTLVFLYQGFYLLGNHNRICKALAGLERHVYHSAEDLVFLADINWDLAENIIAGEYDGLLLDRTTCRYIN